jgi:ketosteroid isomerase-like protein
MIEHHQLGVVQKAYSYFKHRDIQSLLTLVSDDIEWELPEIENVPFSGKRKGKAAVEEFFSILNANQEEVHFMPMEFITQGDKVVVIGQEEWKTREGGHQYKNEWAHIFTVRNGRITAFRQFLDTAVVAAAHKKRTLAA